MSGKILREYRLEAAANWSSFEDFIYRDSTLLASVHPTEGTRWFGPDHLGTPRAVFNSAGSVIGLHTYYPFGEEATAATQDTQQMKFTGHERDQLNTPTGVADDTDYMHARQFSIQTARFMSCDPRLGNPRSPQSWNLYSYVLGNPLKYVDPTGRCAQWIPIKDENGNEVGATCLEEIDVVATERGPGGSNKGDSRKPPRENDEDGRMESTPDVRQEQKDREFLEKNCAGFLGRWAHNITVTNTAIPGLLLPTGAGFLTAPVVRNTFSLPSLLQAARALPGGVTSGGVQFSATESFVLAGSASVANFLAVGGVYELGIVTGSALSAGFTDPCRNY